MIAMANNPSTSTGQAVDFLQEEKNKAIKQWIRGGHAPRAFGRPIANLNEVKYSI